MKASEARMKASEARKRINSKKKAEQAKAAKISNARLKAANAEAQADFKGILAIVRVGIRKAVMNGDDSYYSYHDIKHRWEKNYGRWYIWEVARLLRETLEKDDYEIEARIDDDGVFMNSVYPDRDPDWVYIYLIVNW